MDSRSLLVGMLLVGVAVLGYLYWDSQHNTVFKAPGVEIKKNWRRVLPIRVSSTSHLKMQ